MAHDPAGGWRREMRGEQPGGMLGMLLDQSCAGLARQLAVSAGKGRPFRLGQLELVMQYVAEEDGAVSARAGVDYHVARGVPGCAFEPQPVFECEIVIDQL